MWDADGVETEEPTVAPELPEWEEEVEEPAGAVDDDEEGAEEANEAEFELGEGVVGCALLVAEGVNGG